VLGHLKLVPAKALIVLKVGVLFYRLLHHQPGHDKHLLLSQKHWVFGFLGGQELMSLLEDIFLTFYLEF
jgi:hypothetical protein